MRKFMNVTLYQPAKKVSLKLLGPAIIGGAGVLMAATSSMAGIAELFAAVDLSGVSTGIESIFITLIGIAVLGAAFIYVKRAIPGRF
jgi:LPXTG-motif cell wall-anchored protein